MHRTVIRTLVNVLCLAVLAAAGVALAISVRDRAVRAGDRELLRLSMESACRRISDGCRQVKTFEQLQHNAMLAKARLFAGIVAADPGLVKDRARLAALAGDLDADELVVTDGKGIVVAATIQADVGFDMHAGVQSRAFVAAITNAAFELVQESTRKSNGGRIVQYAGVARRDTPGIVRIGRGTERLAAVRKMASPDAILSNLKIRRDVNVYATHADPKHPRSYLWSLREGRDGRRIMLTNDCDEFRLTFTMPLRGSRLADPAWYGALLAILGMALVILVLNNSGRQIRRSAQDVEDTLKAVFSRDSEMTGAGGATPFDDAVARVRAVKKFLTSPTTVTCLALFFLATAIAWLLVIRVARVDAENLMRTAAADMKSDILSTVDDMLLFSGTAICRYYGTPERIPKKDVAEVLKRYAIDELNVIAADGKVLASSMNIEGVDFWHNGRATEFAERILRDGEETFVQPFRAAVEDPNLFRKYVAVAFPGRNGFVQLGFDYARLHDDVEYRFANCAADWHVGRTGYFLVADEATGVVESCGHAAFKRGDTLATVGVDVANIQLKDGELFESEIYGRRCVCLADRYAFHTVVVALPVSEIAGKRGVVLLSVTTVLFALMLFVAFFTTKLSSMVEKLRLYIRNERERREKDLSVATTIQTSALPVVRPNESDYSIVAEMVPAREVGGDFYDYYSLPDGRILVLIADVSGKGIPAAMFMMRAKAVIRACVFEEDNLAAAVAAANDTLAANNEAQMFVTAWVGALDRETGVVTYVNAGHNPPLVKGTDGAVRWVRGRRSLVLAAQEGVPYRTDELRLAPGERLVLYTDGVSEAMNPASEQFGEKRLEEALTRAPAASILRTVREDVTAFVNGAEPSDDLTMLVLEYKGLSGIRSRTFPATLEGLADATSFLRRTLDGGDCVAKAKSALMVAMDEIASNIVRYSGAPDFTIKIESLAESPLIRVVFSDAGKPYNPLEKADPDVTLSVEEREIGGLGLFMVKKMMDEIDYAHVDGRNVLTIGKRRL